VVFAEIASDRAVNAACNGVCGEYFEQMGSAFAQCAQAN
jgi:hypothetical protein